VKERRSRRVYEGEKKYDEEKKAKPINDMSS